MRWSWVAVITAELRSRAIFLRSPNTRVPRSVLSAAVGSSAKIRGGWFGEHAADRHALLLAALELQEI